MPWLFVDIVPSPCLSILYPPTPFEYLLFLFSFNFQFLFNFLLNVHPLLLLCCCYLSSCSAQVFLTLSPPLALPLQLSAQRVFLLVQTTALPRHPWDTQSTVAQNTPSPKACRSLTSADRLTWPLPLSPPPRNA